MAQQSIVVIDDDIYLDMMQDVLKDAGYSDVTSFVGETAFQEIRDRQPALVLLDINPANPAHGWTTLDRLTLDPQTRDTTVIVCSTDPTLRVEKADILARPKCDVLEKPFLLETLLEKVAAIGPPISTP